MAAHHPIQGVTILCDILRPDGRGNPGDADRAAAWLHNAIKRQIACASQLCVTLLAPSTAPDLARFCAAQRPASQADAFWAAAYARLPPDAPWSAALQQHLLSVLRGQFCIGYELPPYLTCLLGQNAIPYIDIRLHPIRFMDDLLFAVRASHPATRANLSTLAIPEAEIITPAHRRDPRPPCRHRLETPPARAPAQPARRRRRPGRRRARTGQRQSLSPAVHARNHRHPDRFLIRRVRGALFRQDGSHIRRSSHPAGLAMDHDTHASLDEIVLSIDFWRGVLSPHAETSAPDGVRLPPKPNRLRISLDSFWNFNEIDTDRVPARAA